MSVEQAQVLDYIGLDKVTGDIVLTISDHLEWDERSEENHLRLLQEKINAYIGYIESGRAVERYPDAGKRNYVISVVGKSEPSTRGFEFLMWLNLNSAKLVAGSVLKFLIRVKQTGSEPR